MERKKKREKKQDSKRTRKSGERKKKTGESNTRVRIRIHFAENVFCTRFKKFSKKKKKESKPDAFQIHCSIERLVQNGC